MGIIVRIFEFVYPSFRCQKLYIFGKKKNIHACIWLSVVYNIQFYQKCIHHAYRFAKIWRQQVTQIALDLKKITRSQHGQIYSSQQIKTTTPAPWTVNFNLRMHVVHYQRHLTLWSSIFSDLPGAMPFTILVEGFM